MGEYIKSYNVFLSRKWMRWFMYLIYPVLLIAVEYVMSHVVTMFTFICIMFTGASVVVAELVMDMFLFKGIGSKDTNQLEYLKTSVKGLSVLKKSLVFDGVRRFLSFIVIFMGVYAVIEKDDRFGVAFTVWMVCSYAVDMFFATEVALFITRSFAGMVVDFIVIYLFCALVGLGLFLIQSVWVTVLLGVAGVAVAVLSRNRIMKKARESYYDERIEA